MIKLFTVLERKVIKYQCFNKTEQYISARLGLPISVRLKEMSVSYCCPLRELTVLQTILNKLYFIFSSLIFHDICLSCHLGYIRLLNISQVY